jgi:hypothetical protein
MRGLPFANVFEAGHGLLPASEYLRGELPYRDIVPGHGLVSDGLLQTLELKFFGDDYRGLHRGEKLVGTLFWPSLYGLAYAATNLREVWRATFWPSFPSRSISSCPPLRDASIRASLRERLVRLWGSHPGCRGNFEFAAAGGAALIALDRGPRLRHLRTLMAGALASGLDRPRTAARALGASWKRPFTFDADVLRNPLSGQHARSPALKLVVLRSDDVPLRLRHAALSSAASRSSQIFAAIVPPIWVGCFAWSPSSSAGTFAIHALVPLASLLCAGSGARSG